MSHVWEWLNATIKAFHLNGKTFEHITLCHIHLWGKTGWNLLVNVHVQLHGHKSVITKGLYKDFITDVILEKKKKSRPNRGGKWEFRQVSNFCLNKYYTVVSHGESVKLYALMIFWECLLISCEFAGACEPLILETAIQLQRHSRLCSILQLDN